MIKSLEQIKGRDLINLHALAHKEFGTQKIQVLVMKKHTIVIQSKALLLIKEQHNLNVNAKMNLFGIQQTQVHVIKRHTTVILLKEPKLIKEQHNLHAIVLQQEFGTHQAQVLVIQ